MPILTSLICVVSLLLAAPLRAQAVEYTLQMANLQDNAFAYFIRGAIGRGEGELALPRLEAALDSGGVGGGALLYDRDVHAAGEGVARSFSAVAVRPSGYSSSEEKGLWKSVRWDGKPGERAVWMIRPATTHYSEVAHLALSGAPGGLRYFIPYRVTLSPAPSRAVAYALRFLRSGEDGTPLWDEYLSRAIDLRGGPAAVVGVNSLGGDWVYVVVEPPAEPTTFRIAIGWSRRGSNDRVQAGAGSGGIRIK